MPELKKFWLSDAEDKERSSKFVLNGLADFDDENDFNDDFVGGGGGAGRWNLEDVELQKQKPSYKFPIFWIWLGTSTKMRKYAQIW